MRVLMIGLGGIGQRHVRNLRALLGDSVDIIAFRVRGQDAVLSSQLTLESETGLEERYGIRSFRSLDEALDRKPNAAFICNPSSLHIPMALGCAKAGCHLFIEKPLSNTMDGVDELATLVEDMGLVGLVGYQMRFNPCIRTLRSLVEAGAVGRVLTVRAEVGEYMPGWHPYEDYREMYAAKNELGGGVILSQIHELDYLYWLFGVPKQVFAFGGHLSDLEIDVEDVASILMEFMLDGRMVPAHLHQDFIQRPPCRGCRIIGELGKIEVDLRALTVMTYDNDGNVRQVESHKGFDRNEMFIEELKHFLACIEEREEPIVSIRDGAQSLRMALAAKDSMHMGRVVGLWER